MLRKGGSSQITLLRAIPTEFDVHDDASIWEMAHLLAVSRPYFATLPRPPLSASPSAVFRSSNRNMIPSDPPAPSDANYLRNFEPEWGSPLYYYWCEPRRQFYCRLCWKWMDNPHNESNDHVRRKQNPYYYMQLRRHDLERWLTVNQHQNVWGFVGVVAPRQLWQFGEVREF